MTTTMETTVTTQVHRVYIKATPQAIWDAITKPEWTEKYLYQSRVDFDLRPGGAFRASASESLRAMGAPELAVDGEVIEVDPPHRLVQTWRALWDPETAKEITRVTWEIQEEQGGISRLTVIHDLEGAPETAAQVTSIAAVHEGGGGWTVILSGLKTLLETGEPLWS